MSTNSYNQELFYLKETVKQLAKHLKIPENLVIEESFSPQNIHVPITVFSNRNLGVLESLVEHLKDKEDLTYHQIALILKRDDRTIWTAYQQAKKKNGKKKTE